MLELIAIINGYFHVKDGFCGAKLSCFHLIVKLKILGGGIYSSCPGFGNMTSFCG